MPTLTVNSSPVTGIPFKIDATSATTPWTSTLPAGSYTITIQPRYTDPASGITYLFWHWEDGSTEPMRTINLTADMTVTAYYRATHTLTVTSEPITGIPFTIDTTSALTPYSASMPEATYTIKMPSTYGNYQFSHWEDGSTNPTRTINLTADMTITATYVPTGVSHTLTVKSTPIDGIPFTINGITAQTPWTQSLAEGYYTITMPPEYGAYTFSHWEDGSTNPTRTINLTANMIVTATYVAPKHTLTVTSEPVSAIPFSINGVSATTPWTQSLDEGYYTITMPEYYTDPTGVTYRFSHWEDGSTDRTRTINLTADMTITATYVQVPPPPTHTLTVTSEPITGIPFTVNGRSGTTPWTQALPEASYTIKMPSTYGNYQFSHWEDGSTNPTRTINLTADMTVTATYTTVPTASLSGKVTGYGILNLPVANATVTLNTYTTKTASDGTYSFTNIPLGSYTLKVEHWLHQTYTTPINLTEEKPYTQDVKLKLKTEITYLGYGVASALILAIITLTMRRS